MTSMILVPDNAAPCQRTSFEIDACRTSIHIYTPRAYTLILDQLFSSYARLTPRLVDVECLRTPR